MHSLQFCRGLEEGRGWPIKWVPTPVPPLCPECPPSPRCCAGECTVASKTHTQCCRHQPVLNVQHLITEINAVIQAVGRTATGTHSALLWPGAGVGFLEEEMSGL